MRMVQEVTYRYSGVVCRYEEGALYEPVMGIELAIDGTGLITSAENPSIRGSLGEDGRFFWGGLRDEQGSLTAVYIQGHLSPLPPEVRGGPEFDGVYRLIDPGTGREQLAQVGEGFYTWRYLDGEEAGFSPWPTLVDPGGGFGVDLEITTVLELGTFSRADYSTAFSSRGTIVPGAGISLEEFSRTVGTGKSPEGPPQVYAGTLIRAGEYPNEEIPPGIETLVRAGKAAIRAAAKPDRAAYPPWYRKPPVKEGFLYGAGEKTFEHRDTALALAEAAAAANVAEQRRIRIETLERDQNSGTVTRQESLIRTGSLENLPYRVMERTYHPETQTAFVLVELPAD
jgi:hypothetical protein